MPAIMPQTVIAVDRFGCLIIKPPKTPMSSRSGSIPFVKESISLGSLAKKAAVKMITAILAISPGMMVIGPIKIHLVALLMVSTKGSPGKSSSPKSRKLMMRMMIDHRLYR